MKRKLFAAAMMIFTVLLAVILFVSLICGAPIGRGDIGRFVVGALGISILLPSGFTFFFLVTLRLSEKARVGEEEMETEEAKKTAETMQERGGDFYIPSEAQILTLVNTLAEERHLTPEERDRLLSYLEEL